MGHHGGSLELIVLVVAASSLLLLIGVYLSELGYLHNSMVAGFWTAVCCAPLIFATARFLGMA